MGFISSNLLEALGLDWRAMLFYIANIAILVIVIVFVLYRPMKKMLEKKRKSIQDTFDENERLKKESETLNEEFRKKTEELKTESARLSAEIAENAREHADAVINDAKEQARSIIDAAKREAQSQKEQLKTEYRDSVNTLAVRVAQKILEREITDEDNSALIEQVLSDWEE